jgi:hypothetical protein
MQRLEISIQCADGQTMTNANHPEEKLRRLHHAKETVLSEKSPLNPFGCAATILLITATAVFLMSPMRWTIGLFFGLLTILAIYKYHAGKQKWERQHEEQLSAVEARISEVEKEIATNRQIAAETGQNPDTEN